MATRTATDRNYYIRPGDLEISENFNGDAHRFSVWSSGVVKMKAYYPGVSVFETASDGSYKAFQLRAQNIYIGAENYGKDLHLYARIDGSEDVATLAFSPKTQDEYKVSGTPKYDSDGTLSYTSYYIHLGTAYFNGGEYTESGTDEYSLTWDSGIFDSDDYWNGVGELSDAFAVENDEIVPQKKFRKIRVNGEFSANKMEENSVMRLPNGSRMEVPDGNGNVIAGFGSKGEYFSWAGGESGDNSVYSLTKQGKLKARGADIQGQITAQSAVFDGFVQNNFIIVSDAYAIDTKQRYTLDGKYSHIRMFRGTTCVLPIGKDYIGRRIILYDIQSAGGIVAKPPVLPSGSPDYCIVACDDGAEIFGFTPYDIHVGDTVKSIYFRNGFLELLAVPYSSASCRWVVVTNTATWRASNASIAALEKSVHILFYGTVEYANGGLVPKLKYSAVSLDALSVWRDDVGVYSVSVGNVVGMSGESVAIDVSAQCVVTVTGYGLAEDEDGVLQPVVASVRGMEGNTVFIDVTSGGKLADGGFLLKIEYIS